jgi:hypothetical protein
VLIKIINAGIYQRPKGKKAGNGIFLNTCKVQIMLPIIFIIALIVIIAFVVFATKKKQSGEDLGDMR